MTDPMLADAKQIHLVVQEGGSTGEMYPHFFDSAADGEAFRVSCTEGGAYRTSQVVALPASLAECDGFAAAIEIVLRASMHLDYADVDVTPERQVSAA